ncbi:hypothetical protein X753_07655 [Mesorhizobium sp. LNJC399B00]|uniref:hypothetical protein n=2 Tax=Mesorhizobium TaxID=68287 RepID=UPI0003CDD12D|nr:hypothetical protein [Mesorhizobium sp. LSJC265A00]ESY08745.1 hypothetical protein X753_07655 [Mesorhizobium sp. LNJC399B00]
MADDAVTPLDTLIGVIGVLLPTRVRSPARRRTIVTHEREMSEADLGTAVAALSNPRADQLVDSEVVIALLRAIDGLKRGDVNVDPLLVDVVVQSNAAGTI